MKQTLTLTMALLKQMNFQRLDTVLIGLNKRCFCNQLQTVKQNSELATTLQNAPKSDVHISEEIDWTREMAKISSTERSVLAENQEDLSDFSNYLSPTFNFAAYVNKSETLSNFVKLGVDLHRLEKRPNFVEMIMKLDFERDVKGHLTFLNDYVDPLLFGRFLTKNPEFLKVSLDDLETRIQYLESKKFTLPMIQRIVSKNPFWLNFSTLRIDQRLGYFQKEFKLSGNEVRDLATQQSRLITYKLHHVTVNTFAIKEEMGFEEKQIKQLLLTLPRLWMLHHKSLIGRFNYVHNTMKIAHEIICQMPQVLTCRESKIRQRHTFLQKLGKAQYDNTQPNYVSMIKLVEGTDAEFCLDVAKCPVSDFNLYLKSL